MGSEMCIRDRNELRDRYTERVTSRLISKYTIIPLYGDDIRLRKKAKRAD